ncbi:hypothetical protein ACOMHN_040335 [Nucella lapillus]
MSRAAAVHSQSYPPGLQGSYPSAVKQGSGRGGDLEEDERPSRLLQMRDGYQRRLLKEKEERMINMYEDHQKRNQERAERVTRGGSRGTTTTTNNNNNNYPNSKLRQPSHFMQDAHPRPAQMSSSPTLREFFRERRELEAKGGYVPPISQHYKQNKSRTSSSHSFHNTSAGVDRGQPLAPIHTNRSVPASNTSASSSSSSTSPFGNKPRMVKYANTNGSKNFSGGGSSKQNGSSQETDENDNYKINQRDNQKANQPTRNSPRKAAPQPRGKQPGTQRSPDEEPPKQMSDFQKWQKDQHKAREDRLKKVNTRGPVRSSDQDWEEGDEDGQGGRGGGGGDGGKASKDQERMLMEKINQQQAELDRLKTEQDEEAELEKREAEKAAKQEAAQRERRRRQQQQEDARRRREEEAQAKREKDEQRKAAAAARASDKNQTKNTQKHDVQPTPRHPPQFQDSTPGNPPRQKRHQSPPQRRPPSPEEEDGDEEEEDTIPGPGSEIYAQAVEGEQQGGKVKLVPCKLCGRKFADDRVQKHQAACKKVQKKRKVMDSSQMRTEGTEMAKYVSKNAHKQESPKKKKKKADWRRQHEEFIANIRYAKQMQQMEQQGVSPSDLPPPPPSHNPDLVACPHCGRTFHEQTAERHIPRCQQLKTHPAANTKRR